MLRLPSDAQEVSPSFRISLEGKNYILRYLWNFMTLAWYVDLIGPSGEAIFVGRRVTPGGDAAQGVVPGAFSDVTGDAPRGRFLCTGPDPYDRYDLGVTLHLQYATEEEWAAYVASLLADDLVWKAV